MQRPRVFRARKPKPKAVHQPRQLASTCATCGRSPCLLRIENQWNSLRLRPRPFTEASGRDEEPHGDHLSTPQRRVGDLTTRDRRRGMTAARCASVGGLRLHPITHRTPQPSRDRAMKFERLAIATVVALSAAACAREPSKQLQSAETELTSAQAEARKQAAELHEKQAKEQLEAQRKPMGPSEQTELRVKQIEERAEQAAEGQRAVADAEKDVETARATMKKERANVETTAKERITKANANVAAETMKNVNAEAKKREELASAMKEFNEKRTMVEQQLSKLSQVSDADWKKAKDQLDKSLDELDDIVDRIEDIR